jgi:8-oxo-dGTP pyrophosphatase MutT (NUDIX family)
MIQQAAAIPFRRDESGELVVLLIRRKPNGPWGIPKGLIDMGHTAEQAALAEAMEEAGVEGELRGESVGSFRYRKFGLTCNVRVWHMEVTREHDTYLEIVWRERKWFPLDEAADLVRWPGVGEMMKALATT